MKPGPKVDMKMDEKVLTLRNRGLSFREIGKLLGIQVKSVWRRYKRISALK